MLYNAKFFSLYRSNFSFYDRYTKIVCAADFYRGPGFYNTKISSSGSPPPVLFPITILCNFISPKIILYWKLRIILESVMIGNLKYQDLLLLLICKIKVFGLLLCYERNTLLNSIYKVRNIFTFGKNKSFSVGLFSITPELLEY